MTLLLQAAAVSYAHGGHQVFNDLTFEIRAGERLALVGPNGAGKSTLFRLLAGDLRPQGGSVIPRKGVRVGYLRQETEIDPEMTVRDTVALAAGDPEALDRHLTRLEARMAESLTDQELTRVMDDYSLTLARLEEVRDDRATLPGAEILAGLRVPEAHWNSPVGALSGGEKKIVALAGLLADSPDVLLLDEPDNHLDLQAKGWLETQLAGYPGAVATITHDRYFMDRVANRILELEDGRIEGYPGTYSGFVEEKQRRRERAHQLRDLQEREYRKLKESSEQLTQWARQNPKFASRAENQRRKLAEERERLDSEYLPSLDRRKLDLAFEADRTSTIVVDASALAKRYGEKVILRPFDLVIRHGERVGLVGPNGAGKTTLVRLLLGRETPTSGTARIGPSIATGYYAQEAETLPANMTGLDYIRQQRAISEGQALGFLGSMLMGRDTALTKIANLSGGERARLQIAALILGGANFLVLDEPTNNLDLESVEALEAALETFPGTILTISHDRFFLDRICTRTIEVKDGIVRDFSGGYGEYAANPAIGAKLTR